MDLAFAGMAAISIYVCGILELKRGETVVLRRKQMAQRFLLENLKR
jgi:hypothetical protein